MIEIFFLLYMYIIIYGVNYDCLLRELSPLTLKEGIYHVLPVSFPYLYSLPSKQR